MDLKYHEDPYYTPASTSRYNVFLSFFVSWDLFLATGFLPSRCDLLTKTSAKVPRMTIPPERFRGGSVSILGESSALGSYPPQQKYDPFPFRIIFGEFQSTQAKTTECESQPFLAEVLPTSTWKDFTPT